MPAANKTLGPGWRCDACDYTLEGLPDRAEESQCPECGHVGRPVGARPRASTVAVAFTMLLSLGSLVVAGFTAWVGLIMLSVHGPEGWVPIGVATAWLIVAVVVWAALSGRWVAARWLAAVAPAGCAALAAWSVQSITDLIPIAFLCFGVICTSWLINPDLERWLRRRPPRGTLRQ